MEDKCAFHSSQVTELKIVEIVKVWLVNLYLKIYEIGQQVS